MFLKDKLWRRERTTGGHSCSSGPLQSAAIILLAVVLCAFVAPPTAEAQVGATDAFMPRSWQPGAEPSRDASRARSSRRGGVTTTTRLEEFGVPERSARRSARSGNGYTTRIVERKRTVKRVRVAALTNVGVSSAGPRRAVKKRAQATRVAALGGVVPNVSAPSGSLTGGGIAWRASSGCLAGNLRSIVASLTGYGSVTVNSTCRSPGHNRRVGGARKSWHLTGNAVDFRIHGATISAGCTRCFAVALVASSTTAAAASISTTARRGHSDRACHEGLAFQHPGLRHGAGMLFFAPAEASANGECSERRSFRVGDLSGQASGFRGRESRASIALSTVIRPSTMA